MDTNYDGILLGCGHNALVLQAYLSRAGLHCVSLDRAADPGGGLTTIQRPEAPGFLHNTHSFFHRAITSMPWFRDLELELQGVHYIEPDLNVAMILRDGRVLEWWTDLDRTIQSFEQFSRPDAQALKRWAEEFSSITRDLLIPEAQSPPLPSQQRQALLEKSRAGRRLLDVSRRSPLEFVMEEFENDIIRAGLLFFNGLREVDLRAQGFGHSIPSLLASPHKAQMCVGGSRRLAEGLVKDIQAHGGEVRCGVEISRILVQSGKAAGVELSSGERLLARHFVASGLNPQQTFLDLIPAQALDPGLRRKAQDFRYNLLAPLFSLNLSLRRPLRYRAAGRHPELDEAFMWILGLETVDQFHEMVRCHEAGSFPPRVAWGASPTRFDPTQAPEGHHTAFLWQKVPFNIQGHSRNWESVGSQHARDLLAFWAEFAPDLASSRAVVDSFHGTPADTVRTFPNMGQGDLLVGAFAHGQIGYHRPFPGAGRYRTPLPGLYLCGGSTHPGGNITGLCGYNAAAVIAAELGTQPWWNPTHVRDAWGESAST